MAKWADYVITGVWKDSHKRITHVLLHVDGENSFEKGEKKSEAEVIRLLKLGWVIKTITWNYPNWTEGALVTYENRGGTEFLITVKNATIKDNLDNSFPMNI